MDKALVPDNIKNDLIYIVDDECIQATMMQKILQSCGLCNIEIAINGEDALARCAQQEPAAICLDLMLPEMFGLDVLRILRQDYPDIQVIIITAVSTEERAIEAINLGAFAYLQKPYKRQRLQNTVIHALIERKALIELRKSEARYRTLYETAEAAIKLLTKHIKKTNGANN